MSQKSERIIKMIKITINLCMMLLIKTIIISYNQRDVIFYDDKKWWRSMIII
jgi:hypothetical protein